MKQRILLLLFTLAATFAVSAQTYKIDGAGNYYQEKRQTAPKVATFASLTAKAKDTGKAATDSKDVIHKVFESKNGKRFYVQTSKTGKLYNVYLN